MVYLRGERHFVGERKPGNFPTARLLARRVEALRPRSLRLSALLSSSAPMGVSLSRDARVSTHLFLSFFCVPTSGPTFVVQLLPLRSEACGSRLGCEKELVLN